MTSRVRVVRHGDAESFMRRAGAWLLRSEAENTLILGIAADARTHRAPLYCATVEHDDAVVGCALRTMPRKLVVTRMPPSSTEPLAFDAGACFDDLPGVIGPPVAAREFAHHWCSRHGLAQRDAMLQRIYVLTRVLAQERQVPGELRIATLDDLKLVVHWVECFARDAGVELGDVRARMRQRIAAGEMALWHDEEPRSMAGCSGRSPHGIRVGYVYTPPEMRGRGYASACVSGFSRHALHAGARFCCLYTDLSNATSNAIYQRIGYEPIADSVDISFEPR